MMRLSPACKIILREAFRRGFVQAHMQRRRPIERMAAAGLLAKTSLVNYQITALGRRQLSTSKRTKRASP